MTESSISVGGIRTTAHGQVSLLSILLVVQFFPSLLMKGCVSPKKPSDSFSRG